MAKLRDTESGYEITVKNEEIKGHEVDDIVAIKGQWRLVCLETRQDRWS